MVEVFIHNNIKEMSEFKKYRRTQIAEMRQITQEEIKEGLDFNISVSNEDFKSGSPKIGDMVARNPKNHKDQWLVAKQYFEDNFEKL
jgi:hypothetical protein